ncbi:hypothetical protein FISHEDRAFT_48743 [Fistulina hepatica ATCC 64428]|uniref:Uncharacterized protein n=1 Tax=Fistulina hepatica ATCC 64428 TaxID=1128425 RepID=A0A0D7A4U2_9AGAR|nr:hypothetical protein FISHEDRAFT_48743 [Fistulina hepatica ATCC 64428]
MPPSRSGQPSPHEQFEWNEQQRQAVQRQQQQQRYIDFVFDLIYVTHISEFPHHDLCARRFRSLHQQQLMRQQAYIQQQAHQQQAMMAQNPAMIGTFNVPLIFQEALALTAPVQPEDEPLIIKALMHARSHGQTYKDALNMLHGRHGHSAALYKDYYLDNKDRLDQWIASAMSKQQAGVPDIKQKVKKQVVESPVPSNSKTGQSSRPPPSTKPPAAHKPSPTPSGSAARKQASKSRQNSDAPSATPSRRTGRATVNSMTAHNAVFDERLPPPHADLQIPDPPSRSPTPPTLVISKGRGNQFTPQDREFFLRFISWHLKENPNLTRGDLCDALAEKAPHHSSQSWGSYWSNHHDLPDKILSAARGSAMAEEEDGDADGDDDSDTSEEVMPKATTRRGRRSAAVPTTRAEAKAKATPSMARRRRVISADDSSDSEDEQVNQMFDAHGRPNFEVSEMGGSGSAFTAADFAFTAAHIATFSDFKSAPFIEKWTPYGEKYKQRSAKSWAEFYRRNEKALDRAARKIRKLRRRPRLSVAVAAVATVPNEASVSAIAPEATVNGAAPAASPLSPLPTAASSMTVPQAETRAEASTTQTMPVVSVLPVETPWDAPPGGASTSAVASPVERDTSNLPPAKRKMPDDGEVDESAHKRARDDTQ